MRYLHKLANNHTSTVITNWSARYFRCQAAALFCLFGLCAGAQPAQAFTECEAKIEKIWSGDVGYIWLHLVGGGAAVVLPNDPNKESVLAMGLTARAGSRKVIIRYAANSANCNEFGRTNFVGMYLF